MYYIHTDGRCSKGTEIASDGTVKAFKGKGYIYAVCGYLAAFMIIDEVLKRKQNPMEVLKLLHSKQYNPYLWHCGVLVATEKYGAYTIDVEPDSNDTSKHKISIVRWGDKDLPQLDGSGSKVVGALLAQHVHPSPEQVKKSFLTAYKVDHTIGGEITELSLKAKKER